MQTAIGNLPPGPLLLCIVRPKDSSWTLRVLKRWSFGAPQYCKENLCDNDDLYGTALSSGTSCATVCKSRGWRTTASPSNLQQYKAAAPQHVDGARQGPRL